jgi:hypothetical protein
MSCCFELVGFWLIKLLFRMCIRCHYIWQMEVAQDCHNGTVVMLHLLIWSIPEDVASSNHAQHINVLKIIYVFICFNQHNQHVQREGGRVPHVGWPRSQFDHPQIRLVWVFVWLYGWWVFLYPTFWRDWAHSHLMGLPRTPTLFPNRCSNGFKFLSRTLTWLLY